MSANCLMRDGLSGPGRPSRKAAPVAAVLGAIALMYTIDAAEIRFAPGFAAAYTANFAVPFDLMVCVPLVFYFLFVRRRGITPIAVLPVIYAGGAASAFVAVHILVSRFSAIAAVALTTVSLYGLAWLGSFARSVVECPILVCDGRLTAAWGFLPGIDLPAASIERVAFVDPGFGKGDVLDLATMGAAPCWVVLREPVEVRGITGRARRVRAVKLSPDDVDAFARSVARLVEGECRDGE